MSNGFTLYRLFNAAGELLYIGKSIHRYRRLDEHCRNQPWASEIASSHFQEFADEASLSAAEIAAIKRERPKYNKAHATCPVTVAPDDDDVPDREFLSFQETVNLINCSKKYLRFLIDDYMLREIEHPTPDQKARGCEPAFNIPDEDVYGYIADHCTGPRADQVRRDFSNWLEARNKAVGFEPYGDETLSEVPLISSSSFAEMRAHAPKRGARV